MISFRIFTFITTLLMAHSAYAEKMDAATDSVVIEKLRGVLDALPANNPARSDLVLRLADLYSERSRLEAMDEVAKNCEKCVESRNDRQQALKLYQEGILKADKETKAKVILQTAQLFELQGQSDEAKKVYENVINHKDQYSPELLGQSYSGLGEIYFRKIKYTEAQNLFELALKIPQTPKKPHIIYRLSWCYFHKEKQAKATELLAEVLKSSEVAGDNSFREEGSRDLATFLSRGKVESAQIQLLSSLSPDNVRKDNLTYLAQELDRLGKKSQAVLVWNVVGQGEKSPRDQMESHLRMAELQYDSGKKKEAFEEFKTTVELWKNDGCDAKDECSTIRNRIRKLVIDWNRSEQDAPTPVLASAYSTYVGVFPDMEMNYRAALVARKLNQLTSAINLYRQAAELAFNSLKNGLTQKQDVDVFQKDFEASLLGEIEVAEMTKDPVLKNNAYAHYLSLNPGGKKAFEVRYQQAHVLYETGHAEEASHLFKALALTENGSRDLRGKSADLSLDALVLAKKEELISDWAIQYAKAFPERKAEFLKMASKGTLNEVVQTINDPGAGSSRLRGAFDKLNQLNLSTASSVEKTAYYRNKLIIAEKLKDIPEVRKAASSLLAMKFISAEDRELSLSRQAWVAELTLDFGTAYSITRRLKMTSLSPDERLLKLAFLAELSGHNSTGYYEEYLKVSQDPQQSAVVAAKLIRGASHQRAALAKYERYLTSRPDMIAELALEIFAKDHDYSFARQMMKDKTIQNTSAAQVFSRFLYIKDFRELEKMVSSQHLETRSDSGLKHSLKHRLDLLKKMEVATQHALKSEDWVLQIITLDALSKQNRRLAAEIIALGTPRGLSRNQKLQYKELLAEQARQYQTKGRTLTEAVAQLWNKDAMASNLLEEYKKAKSEVRHLLAEELKIVAKVAPREQRAVFVQALATGEAHPAAVNLSRAKETVKENPFNVSSIENLKTLEERAGSDTMVAYLDARISKLQNGTFTAERSGVKR